ncbi:MAG: HNH endonuclease, partial [Hymenobacteraceae bacterium]|nr:HNH endonuclease [Hymenobacteraceae bacterium]MDX5395674.1 HNH endonuclease [Hymenobacteraceae bacterium]MDX5511727.1 HNH endonuclease [Hymenobacteraceae bacterium]
MAEITNQLVEQAYEIGKQIFRKQISLKVGIENLVRQGMNQSSAHDYVYSYSNLIQGKLFTRTTNTYGTEYYLERIYQEEGVNGLENALLSLSQHIDYYEELTGSAVKKRKEIYNKYLELLNIDKDEVIYPDDLISDDNYSEGKSKFILVNSYERNPVARKKCLEYHGVNCRVCDMNFEKVFGSIGREFIHVHHKIELSTIGKEYSVNPITDLVPVCPNCHAMLHKK